MNFYSFIQNLKNWWSKTNRFHRVLLLFAFVELQPVPGGKLGFYCGDPALSHPFTGDTISWKWLMAVCTMLPLLVMLIVERKYHNIDGKDKPNKRVFKWYKEYMFGYLLNLCIVQTLKYVVGSPRPHFFDTCNPKEAAACKESEYVSSYTCMKGHWNWQSDKSFPSGHTSLALHAGLFLIIYVHRRAPGGTAWVGWQVACASAAAVCAVSRLCDRRHHWWDVAGGALIALPIAEYTINRLCKKFSWEEKSRLDASTASDDATAQPGAIVAQPTG